MTDAALSLNGSLAQDAGLAESGSFLVADLRAECSEQLCALVHESKSLIALGEQ